jgi:hypothetical protein
MLTFIAAYLFLKAVIHFYVESPQTVGILAVLLLATVLAAGWVWV